MKNLRKREKRAKEKLASVLIKLEDTITENEDLSMQMESFSHIPLELFHRHHTQFSEEQKKFAVTLHLYSSKAYDFVQQHIPLPHPRTLRR